MNAQTNPIVVGKKQVANYALAIQARLGAGEKNLTIRARGKHISLAFDAANMAINLGLPLSRGEIRWNQEMGPGQKNVSWVEIDLASTVA